MAKVKLHYDKKTKQWYRDNEPIENLSTYKYYYPDNQTYMRLNADGTKSPMKSSQKYIIINDANGNYVVRQDDNGSYTKQSLRNIGDQVVTEDGIVLNDSNTVKAPPMYKPGIERIRFHDTFFPIDKNDLYGSSKEYYEKVKTYRDPSENLGNDLLAGGLGTFRAGLVKMLPQLFKNTIKSGTNSVMSALRTIANNSPKRVAQKATSKVLETFFREAPRIGLGLAASKGVDTASEALTGKTFGENVADELSARYRFEVPVSVGEMFNPGSYLGYNYADLAIRKAAYNQITPASYDNRLMKYYSNEISKNQQFWRTVRDSFNPKVTFGKLKHPEWRRRIETSPEYKPDDSRMYFDRVYDKAVLNNREDAFKLALKLGKPELYRYNGNGTFSYNTTNDYMKRTFVPESDFIKLNLRKQPYIEARQAAFRNGKMVDYDAFTTNGGYVTVRPLGHNTFVMEDTWDLQPFLDATRRNDLNFGFDAVKKTMNKIAPDFEVLHALGGKPIKVAHVYSPDDPSYIAPDMPVPLQINNPLQPVPNLINGLWLSPKRGQEQDQEESQE